MRLDDLQRALRDVLQGPDVPPSANDADLAGYIATVASSDRLDILLHIIRSWRAYDLQRSCPLAVAALRTCGVWQQALDRFNAERTPSAFIERLADRFLDTLAKHDDPLVASVARFERAYRAVQQGSEERFTVWWDREPRTALIALLTDKQLNEAEPPGTYATIVARDLPRFFEVVSGLEDSH